MSLRDVAGSLLAEAVALDPCAAVIEAGVDHVDGLTDFSPAGHAARADHARRFQQRLGALTTGPGNTEPRDTEPRDTEPRKTEPRKTELEDALLRAHLMERLDSRLALYAAGEPQRELHALVTGPLQMLNLTISSAIPAQDADADARRDGWAQVLLRLRALPDALAGYTESLRESADLGRIAARRQVEVCVARCAGWAADAGALLKQYGDGPLAVPLRTAVYQTGAAYARLETFLTTELAPKAPEAEAFGAERYALWARSFLGVDLDLTETYAWGWEEFHRISAELTAEARKIVPSGNPAEAVAILDDPQGPGWITGRDEFRYWLQQLMDDTTARLDGAHFTIPPELRRLEVNLQAVGGIFYTAPSQNLSRPGRVSWAANGEGQSTWLAYSIAFHEGVPGHHLQLGRAGVSPGAFGRDLDVLGGLSGCYEGWALYAEALMDELGHYTAPGSRFGYLSMQLLRAARVILDIGLHLELPLPTGSGLADGERWTPELGARMLRERCFMTDGPELVRYLGRPGQAPAYKVGERVYLDARAAAQRRPGFNARAFHDAVLRVPLVGLGHLDAELAKATGR